MKKQIVAYVRVSTQKQGVSGLGLDAQRTAIEAFARANDAAINQTYVEVESGRCKDRPQLHAAIQHAKRVKGQLVIAKLDRLARSVAFVSALMESGVDFVATDNPHANKLTLHILAAIGEHEAEMISARTKAALAAAKARGVRLGSAREGSWRGREEVRASGQAKATAAASQRWQQERSVTLAEATAKAQEWRGEGFSLQSIADRLNAEGIATVGGTNWHRVQVARLLQYHSKAAA